MLLGISVSGTHIRRVRCASRASATEAFLVWLTQHMSLDGMPALMAIVCEGDVVSWQVAAATPTGDEE